MNSDMFILEVSTLITKERFERIAQKYGHYASWAIWEDEGDTPKSNMGNLDILDPMKNPRLPEQLNPEVVMVGLNFSRHVTIKTFGNFHDSSPHAQDYKIRFAFRDTPYYGAYMTDIIKDFEELISGKVKEYLRTHPEFERQNALTFEREITDLGSDNPLIIAFGRDSYNILLQYFKDKYRLVMVTHYSHYINKEVYRETVLKQLGYNINSTVLNTKV